ncbi:MAG: SDR family oxidoreductase [Elusimicrobia bacterium]|nr:SDR family oxidoreductase [Elusimicrobiota bacterium]
MAERVLVVGAGGLIGNALCRAWERRGVQALGADLHCRPGGPFRPLDITDASQVESMVRDYRPGLVALPAANPHVDFCETHPEETARVNVEAALRVERECRAVGARMAYFSSDYVFDGVKGSYAEDDPPSPLNEYGRQKARVEKALLASDPRHLVVRTSGVYGWQWRPQNFVLQVLSALGAGRQLRVTDDVRYNPTYAENLAEVVADLCACGAGGVFHVVGSDRMARLAFARQVAAVFGLDAALLVGVPSVRAAGHAPRPKESSLETAKVAGRVRRALWGAREGLSDMLRRRAAWEEYAETALPQR